MCTTLKKSETAVTSPRCLSPSRISCRLIDVKCHAQDHSRSAASSPTQLNQPFFINDKVEEPQMEIDSKDTPAICQPTTADRLEVVSKVEAILESVIDSLLQKQKKIHVPIHVKKQPPKPSKGSASRSFTASAWTRVLVNFPGRDSREVFRFGRCLLAPEVLSLFFDDEVE